MKQLEETVLTMKNKKARGADSIPPEVHKLVVSLAARLVKRWGQLSLLLKGSKARAGQKRRP